VRSGHPAAKQSGLKGGNRARTWLEWALVGLLLLVGFWFRTYRLAEVPPGLHHDDIKNVILVQRIIDGYIRIYYQENNGDEPLYHWMQAIYFAIVGTGYPEVRLLSIWTTMAGLATTYALVRRLLGRNVALWMLAWHAVSLWSFFYARRAVRPVLLWPVAGLVGVDLGRVGARCQPLHLSARACRPLLFSLLRGLHSGGRSSALGAALERHCALFPRRRPALCPARDLPARAY
jgi:hypothetical protein